ncbi:uncharacterized protein LOC124924247 [Impatiens glandulifera]|uniref:uncharacterized protein LOC124924247 n=1 Tax=Impatiens glandulifera TaxID=253017 RepID=UPI001FB10974|nr:uncharacterized protein LOC124924247 [Impatiens glandulifera]
MESPIIKHDQINDTNINISSDHQFNCHPNTGNKHYLLKCCGCIAALTSILFVTFLILFFTIFRIKNPIIKLNSITINGVMIDTNGSNFILIADVSIRNPNLTAFKFGNATTEIYYGAKVMGEDIIPTGESKAKETMRMNMTIEIMAGKLLEDTNFRSDPKTGELRMRSYTRIEGRVKITRLVKKHVVATMNCTIIINVKSMAVENQNC